MSLRIAWVCVLMLASRIVIGAEAQPQPPPAPTGIMRWLNPSTAPFIPVPEVDLDPYAGTTLGRIFAFPSDNTQWSIVGGAKQRIESEFDAEYAAGLRRLDPWSVNFSAVYDRSGSPRFFGIGNESPLSNQTNYTDEQRFVQLTFGRNFNPEWQLAYTFRARSVEILPGKLP